MDDKQQIGEIIRNIAASLSGEQSTRGWSTACHAGLEMGSKRAVNVLELVCGTAGLRAAARSGS